MTKFSRLTSLLRRWRRDRQGVTAVEFGMVALPFMMMLFGIIGVGLYFFTTFSVENGVEVASRTLRTGSAQTTNMTAAQFATSVCNQMPSFVDCTSKLQVKVQSYASSAQISAATIPSCLNGAGGLDTSTVYAPGTASQIVLVIACYQWDMTKVLPFFNWGTMSDGSMLIQASTTFRTEPYN